MINWEVFEKQSGETDEILNLLGVQLKEAYYDLITGKSEDEYTETDSLIISVVDDVSKLTAEELSDAYKNLAPPRMNDSIKVALTFIAKIPSHLQDAICREMSNSRDLISNHCDLAVLLAPLIATSFTLISPNQGIAIQSAMILAKIGMKSYCYEYNKKSKSVIAEETEKILQSNIQALMFLERESELYIEEPVPEKLRMAITYYEHRVKQYRDILELVEKDMGKNKKLG